MRKGAAVKASADVKREAVATIFMMCVFQISNSGVEWSCWSNFKNEVFDVQVKSSRLDCFKSDVKVLKFVGLFGQFNLCSLGFLLV